MSNARNLGVLLRKALGSVNHYNADLRSLNRHFRSDNGIFFYLVINTAFSAQTRSIDKNKSAVFVFNNGVRCIAGSARNVGNNHPVFAEHGVDKGGFTHIGLADNGNLYCVIKQSNFTQDERSRQVKRNRKS